MATIANVFKTTLMLGRMCEHCELELVETESRF
jgi:hypothetical protein